MGITVGGENEIKTAGETGVTPNKENGKMFKKLSIGLAVVVMAVFAALMVAPAVQAESSTVTANGNGTAILVGTGTVTVSGNGVLSLKLTEGTTYDGSATWSRKVERNGWAYFYGYNGEMTINCAACTVRLVGREVNLTAEGEGRVYLRGTGEATINGEAFDWTRRGRYYTLGT